jgi:hypothetical protein
LAFYSGGRLAGKTEKIAVLKTIIFSTVCCFHQ